MRIITGERVGRSGRLVVGCSGALYDEEKRLLLTRRSDNGQWCLPGGHMDPGESASEACIREVLEETGYRTAPEQLIGAYSSPDYLVEYRPGEAFQVVAFLFALRVQDVVPVDSAEVLERRFVSKSEAMALELLILHVNRIHDAFAYADTGGPWMTKFD